MRPTNGKIIVKVDQEQKKSFQIEGITFSTALKFEVNYREKSPIIAHVVEGNEWVKEGDLLLCHHNNFYLPSPYHLQDDLFAIPAGKTIFAVINKDGSLTPLYGNLLCETIEIENDFYLAPEYRKKHLNRVRVINGGMTGFHKGDLVFHRPSAWYTIVYILGGQEIRIEKLHEDQICGVVRKR